MINVIANIELNEGFKDEFLAIFKANVPNVLKENGCLKYEPNVDADSGVPAQGGVRKNVVTIVEAWESLDALFAHMKAPHMLAYKEKTKDMVKQLTLQVLQPA